MDVEVNDYKYSIISLKIKKGGISSKEISILQNNGVKMPSTWVLNHS